MMESLKTGLERLGVKGKITAYPLKGSELIFVLLNNKYFGVWDIRRETFID